MKKQRKKKILYSLIAIAVFGIIYLFVFLKFGFGIPCIFYKITGMKCPGCGMTHAIAELSQGNVKLALEYNALCLTALPVLCLYLLYRAMRYVNGKDEGFYIWEYVLLIVLFVVVVRYGIVRNNLF